MNPVIEQMYADCRVFPLIVSMRYLNDALEIPGTTAIILGDVMNVMNVKRIVKAVHEAKKLAFIDADLLAGLNSDNYATNYLVHEVKADAIISRNRNVINAAQKLNTWGILKAFLQDNMSLETAISNIEACRPSSLDLIPGAAVPFALKQIRNATKVPVGISGFFDESRESVEEILAGSVDAVHTRNRELWKGIPL